MTREHHTELVSKSERVTTVKIKCNKCNKPLDRDGYENELPNELIILLNNDECVSNRFRLDLCVNCLNPIWLDLCQLIGRDPDDISGSDFNDEQE